MPVSNDYLKHPDDTGNLLRRKKMKTTRTRMAAGFALALALGLAATAEAARPGDRSDRRDQRDWRDRRDHRPDIGRRHDDRSVHDSRTVIVIRPNAQAWQYGQPRPLARLIAGLISHGSSDRYAPRGRWETRTVRVLVQAGHWRTRRVPAVYETRRGFRGRTYTVCVQPERIERVWVPDRYEYRTQQVWVSY